MDFEHSKGDIFDSLLGKSFESYSQVSKETEVSYIAPLEELGQEGIPLFEEEDRDILMHRDAHFSKSFPLMSDYYDKEGKGSVLDIFNSRIDDLMLLEEKLGRDLAPLVLQGADAERIGKARAMYQVLKQQYENPASPKELLELIDLIFSEKEEPEDDAKRAALIGKTMIPYLISVIKTEELYDPLFPGYGKAPIAAALALGLLKAEEAIIPLFLMLGRNDFDIESAGLSSLALIGEKAKHFCLNVLKSRPLTQDNERAAIAISAFSSDDSISEMLFSQLEDKEVQKKEPLIFYLIAACENLPKNVQPALKKIADSLPEKLKKEMISLLSY